MFLLYLKARFMPLFLQSISFITFYFYLSQSRAIYQLLKTKKFSIIFLILFGSQIVGAFIVSFVSFVLFVSIVSFISLIPSPFSSIHHSVYYEPVTQKIRPSTSRLPRYLPAKRTLPVWSSISALRHRVLCADRFHSSLRQERLHHESELPLGSARQPSAKSSEGRLSSSVHWDSRKRSEERFLRDFEKLMPTKKVLAKHFVCQHCPFITNISLLFSPY